MGLLQRFSHLTSKKNLSAAASTYKKGIHDGNAAGLPGVDPDLVAANIKYQETVFGIVGTMVQWVYDLMAKTGKGYLTVVPPSVAETVEQNAGSDNPSSPPELTIVEPTVSDTVNGGTVASFTGGVSHKQTGPVDADQTAETGNATANDMNLLPASGNATGDGFYFGMDSPFDGIAINVGTAGTGTYTIAWKYWNGAWVSLPASTYSSINHFKTTGVVSLMFTRPADWATIDIATIGAKYYIKAEATMGTMTAQPKGTQAWANTY